MPDSPSDTSEGSSEGSSGGPGGPETPEQRVQTIRQMQRHFHDQIGARTESAVADLNTRWQGVRATLDEHIAQLTTKMRQAQEAGDTVNLAWLTRAREMAQLKASVMGNVGDFANEAAALSGDAMWDALDLGQGAAQAFLAASVPPGLAVTFGVPPSDVLDAAAGALQPGSPLQGVFSSFASDAWQAAQQALFTSIALGDSAAVTAERLEWATNMPLQRATVVARTEMHRAWRGAQMANYQANSDVVQGWMWAADFGPRSCGACIALDGTTHSLDEDFDDHICGRCSALPITLPWSQILGDAGMSQQQIADLGLTGAGETSAASWAGLADGGVFRTRETGAEWFARQDAETQNRILGPAAAEAWRAGDVTLDDFVGYKESPTWGTSIYQKSLKELDLDANAYLRQTRAKGTDSVVGGEVTPDTTIKPLSPEQFAQQQRDALTDPAAIAARQAAANAWYADVQRSIDGITSGTVDDWADAHHGLDAWHDQMQAAIAAGEPIPIYDWDIRREEAIAVAEGRASWLSEGRRGPAESETAYAPLSAPGGYNAAPVETYTLTADDHAFLTRLNAGLPEGGVASANEAIALGRQIADRIHSDPQVAELQNWAREAAEIRTRLPGNVTEEERAWFAGGKSELALQAAAAHGGVSPFKVEGLYQAAYQARARALLSAFRETGGVDLSIAEGADAVVAARLDVAKDLLPADWLGASNDLGELSLIKSSERSSGGWFQAVADGNGTLAVRYVKASDAADLESTALHELTHRMEQAVPDLTTIEQQFYDARTAGEAFVDLTNGVKEQTKLDQWLDEYLGRRPLYISGTAWDHGATDFNPGRESYELVTMGAEMALAPGASANVFALHADSEYEAFVLGALFGVKAPEEAAAAAAAEGEATAGETAFAAKSAKAAGTTLSGAERQAVRDAAAAGDLPKSYAKYSTVEQLTKTAKGREWFAGRATEPAPAAAEVTATAETAALTRDALSGKSMADLRQIASDAGVQPARSKAETIDRILATHAEQPTAPAAEASASIAAEQTAVAFTPDPPFTSQEMVEAFDGPDATRMGGVNGARLTTIGERQFIVKQLDNEDALGHKGAGIAEWQARTEAVANTIAQALDMQQYVTPTWALEQDGRHFVASAYLSDATSMPTTPRDALFAVPPEQFGDVTLLNYVLGEQDDNSANLLYDASEGRLVTIDHTASLASKYPYGLGPGGAPSMYWHMQALGEADFSAAYSNVAGYNQMLFSPARIQAILDAQPQLEAILKERGFKSAIGPLRQRLANLRKLSQHSAPSYDDLFEIIYGFRKEEQVWGAS